jgi:DNA-binding MarR family transcriptional regulator
MRSSISRRERVALEEAKAANVPQLLLRTGRLVNEYALGLIKGKAGVPDLRQSHLALVPHIEFEGTRLTTLAQRTGLTKQAVGQLIDEMEAAGVVERIADPDDKRAKLVRFTRRGAEVIGIGLSTLHEVQRELEQKIGKAEMARLNDILLKLLPHLEAWANVPRK